MESKKTGKKSSRCKNEYVKKTDPLMIWENHELHVKLN